MSRKRYTVEQIIHKLREAEVELSRGKKLGQIVRDLGITKQTYYRGRREYNTLRPHSSLALVSRYSHPSSEDKLRAVNLAISEKTWTPRHSRKLCTESDRSVRCWLWNT